MSASASLWLFYAPAWPACVKINAPPSCSCFCVCACVVQTLSLPPRLPDFVGNVAPALCKATCSAVTVEYRVRGPSAANDGCQCIQVGSSWMLFAVIHWQQLNRLSYNNISDVCLHLGTYSRFAQLWVSTSRDLDRRIVCNVSVKRKSGGSTSRPKALTQADRKQASWCGCARWELLNENFSC